MAAITSHLEQYRNNRALQNLLRCWIWERKPIP